MTLRKITFWKYYCFRTLLRPKSTFVPKGIPIGFQMAEKKRENTNTHTHFRIYISRDTTTMTITN